MPKPIDEYRFNLWVAESAWVAEQTSDTLIGLIEAVRLYRAAGGIWPDVVSRDGDAP